jgi:protein-S-isoprenylcysteine O-methyltransferase Ste14
MPTLSSPLAVISLIMIINAILSVPFGVLASRSFQNTGKLSAPLAIWSGIAMHGHAVMTFAVAWLDRVSLYNSNIVSWVIGALLIIGGVYVIYLGRKAYGDKLRVYGLKEDALITTGIYQRSRNPQYFGYGVMFLGAAIGLGSITALVFVAIFAVMVHAGVALVEEPHLQRIFGKTYTDYKKTAGRYFKAT